MVFNQVFQFLVLFQPVFWGYLYTIPLKLGNNRKLDAAAYFLFAAVITGLLITGFEVGYYKNHLLVMYTLLVSGSYTWYRRNLGVLKALSLAFLTIYLNSYFWEFPMHMAEYASLSFYPAQLHQLWRLSPLIVIRYEFRGLSWRYVKLGVVVSSLLFWARFYHWVPRFYGVYVMHLNRVVCAYLLTRTLVEAENSWNVSTS